MKPNDPMYKDQWHLRVLDMEKVWDVEIGKPEVIVAVIGAGFDVGHPDLRSQIHKRINTAGPDDQMVSENPDAELADAETDLGTHVLGLIGAEMDNRRGGVGVAPGCRLMPVKVGNRHDDGDLAEGIRRSVDEGARIIAMADARYCYLAKHEGDAGPRRWGPPRDARLLEACRYAVENDVLICTDVGSSQAFQEVSWPAAYRMGLNVTEGGVDGLRPSNACTESDVADVMAPGGERGATDDPDAPLRRLPNERQGLLSTVQVRKGSYRSLAGGPMAAAVASGVAGLVCSRMPDLGVAALQQVLRNTATGTGWDRRRGHGRLNPLAAVQVERAECEIAIDGVRANVVDGSALVTATIRNLGVLDAADVTAMLFANDVDTPEGRQLSHRHLACVRGRESVTVSFDEAPLPEGTQQIYVVVDPRFQLAESQMRRPLPWIKARAK